MTKRTKRVTPLKTMMSKELSKSIGKKKRIVIDKNPLQNEVWT